MDNMGKVLTVPKWVLINQTKILQMPQKFSAQFVWPSPKVWDFWKKKLLLVSIVRETQQNYLTVRISFQAVNFIIHALPDLLEEQLKDW